LERVRDLRRYLLVYQFRFIPGAKRPPIPCFQLE
jgi:hypothetical protein